jgi:hypothetical protein
MKNRKRRLYPGLVLLVATAAFGFGSTPAGAQYGMGMGMGFFGGFGQVPSPSQFINDHALVRAGAGRREPARNVYSNNSNSYINRIRDNGFSAHSSTRSHRSPGYDVDRRAARSLSPTSNNAPQPTPEAASRPVHPIASFFNAARQLVWPSEAPATDELKPRRVISDQACLVVLELVEKHRSAPITTVTDARQKLLDYGQPALQFARSVSTPTIAESFHMFLLSLYDSLAAAANPVEAR